VWFSMNLKCIILTVLLMLTMMCYRKSVYRWSTLDEGDHVIHDDVGAQDTQGLDANSPAIVNSPILQPTHPMVVNRPVRV
jgi:hypothetical protein